MRRCRRGGCSGWRRTPSSRDDHILLSRLAKRLTSKELWTLPGGGLEHGEDPRDAVVREVHEETGLDVVIDETAHVYSYHQRNTWRQGRRADAHALRIVYDGWVPLDSPEPHVVEVDGSTMEAAWQPVAAVLDGSVPVVGLVTEVLAEHRPFQLQRVAAYALVVRDGAAGPEVLLTRNSARGPHPGWWTLPGGGIDHGEEARHGAGPRGPGGDRTRLHARLRCWTSAPPTSRAPPRRGAGRTSTRCRSSSTPPSRRGEPAVQEVDGTTDAAAWVPVSMLGDDALPDPGRGPVGARRPRA